MRAALQQRDDEIACSPARRPEGFGNGSVNVLAGTTILTAGSTYTGGTAISAGTLQLGNGETTGSIVGDVTNNGTLAFNRSDTVTFPGVISAR